LLFRVVGRINETHWELRRKVLLKLNLLLWLCQEAVVVHPMVKGQDHGSGARLLWFESHLGLLQVAWLQHITQALCAWVSSSLNWGNNSTSSQRIMVSFRGVDVWRSIEQWWHAVWANLHTVSGTHTLHKMTS
jgi:hypothetical protein